MLSLLFLGCGTSQDCGIFGSGGGWKVCADTKPFSRQIRSLGPSQSTPPTFHYSVQRFPNFVTFSVDCKCYTQCCDTLPLRNFHRIVVKWAKLNWVQINENTSFSPPNFPFWFAPFGMSSPPSLSMHNAHVQFMFFSSCKTFHKRNFYLRNFSQAHQK